MQFIRRSSHQPRLFCCPLLVEMAKDETGVVVQRHPSVYREDKKKDVDSKFSFVLETLLVPTLGPE